MFNPFKKKDDMSAFKLDEESLSSLSDMNREMPMPNESSAPSNNDFGNTHFDNMQTEQDFSSPVGTNSSSSAAPSNPFATQSNNPFMNSSLGAQQSMHEQQGNSNLHNDLAKAKLEILESKISLMDAKIANIDHKIDMIYQLMLAEVSDETKARFNIGNSLNSLKKR